MKKPKPIEQICKRCYNRFIAEAVEDWEYNERGDDKLIGYFYSRICNECNEYESNLQRGSKEYGKILYDMGLITKEDWKNHYNN